MCKSLEELRAELATCTDPGKQLAILHQIKQLEKKTSKNTPQRNSA